MFVETNTPRTFIFDFDGTIADTFKKLVSIVLANRKSLGIPKITEEDILVFKGTKSQEAIRKWGVPFYKVPILVLKIRNELHKDISKVQPIEGMKETIAELHAKNISLGVLTSNSSANVQAFLSNNGIAGFDFIYTNTNIWGKDKSLIKVLKELKIDKTTVIYIGDETRDIEAAKKVGIKVATVTWGFQNESLLLSLKPDFLIHRPVELLGL